jgi:hypothetical protein
LRWAITAVVVGYISAGLTGQRNALVNYIQYVLYYTANAGAGGVLFLVRTLVSCPSSMTHSMLYTEDEQITDHEEIIQ